MGGVNVPANLHPTAWAVIGFADVVRVNVRIGDADDGAIEIGGGEDVAGRHGWVGRSD